MNFSVEPTRQLGDTYNPNADCHCQYWFWGEVLVRFDMCKPFQNVYLTSASSTPVCFLGSANSTPVSVLRSASSSNTHRGGVCTPQNRHWGGVCTPQKTCWGGACTCQSNILEWFAHVKSDQNFTPGSILTVTIGVWIIGVPQLKSLLRSQFGMWLRLDINQDWDLDRLTKLGLSSGNKCDLKRDCSQSQILKNTETVASSLKPKRLRIQD